MSFAADAEGTVVAVLACGAFPVVFVINWAFVGASNKSGKKSCAAGDGITQGTGLRGGTPIAHAIDGKAMMGRECGGEVGGHCVETKKVG